MTMTTPSPTWFEHPDLMNLVIIILALALLWFVRREFTKFDTKLSRICATLDTKSDKKEVKEVQDALWTRVNTHGHRIKCNIDTCKPETNGILLHEE